MIRRKYIVLLLLTLISILLAGLLYSNVVHAQTTVTSYVSVPAAAFVPYDSTYPFRVDPYLRNLHTTWVNFYAPVQLPHGATVKKLTCYWYDAGSNDIGMVLQRYNMSHYFTQTLATTISQGNAGDGSSYDDTIDFATVDNSHYAYIMGMTLYNSPGGSYYLFKYAVIEYSLPSGGAVGGMWIPVDKFSLLAPYIALVSTIILAISISVAYIKYRKKQ